MTGDSQSGDSRSEDGPTGEGAGVQARLEIVCSDRVNFAMQQNGVPLVEEVRITSDAAGPVEGVTVEVSLENGEAEPWTGRLERLEPGITSVLEPDGFVLSGKTLASRTEAERSSIVASVTGSGVSGRASVGVDLLAFDQWPGVGHYPELTAAFVTPNHPVVAELLGGAREALRGVGAGDALDGYQSGSRTRASQIAEACFNAVASRGIGYINPPASFETQGQRVRLVDRLSREGLGTCLDLSLLLMSVWEQSGLHGLLLLPEGHAMPAVWTHEAHLPEVVIDEPSRIRNLIELGEIVPVEATLLTQPGASFASAVVAAKKRMENPGGRFHAVDVVAGRKRGIRPLPLRVDGDTGVDLEAVARGGPAAAVTSTLDRVALAERAEGSARERGAEGADESGSDRINRWQTKLLDLSLRNRLLNFRETGRTVPLSVPDLAALEDKLADGGRFTIYPRPDSEQEAFLREEMDAFHLYTGASAAETQKRLLTLYRTAKSSIEETGANLLHLAVGMLKWYESDSSETARLAPLILLPVTLARSSTGSGYSYALRLSDEPLRPNVTLLEKLRTEFGLDTTGLDDLPEDESGLDVPLILRNFRAAIRETSRWEVSETAYLGLFSFNKFLMWRDLQENLERLKESRLVGHLVDRPDREFDARPFPEASELDDECEPGELLCTRDADSSQLAAVRASAQGRTLVLEGPPGTGKSQTIANIIADTLARGRRVLFVAEKMAALSVVRKRLEEDGLGPFCLELHSAMASKKEVLAQLGRALESGERAEPAEWEALCRDLGTTRDGLNTYVREMHRVRETGESLYRVLGRLSQLGEGPTVVPPVENVAATTADQLEGWRRLIGDLGARARPIDPPSEHPLRGVGQAVWSFSLPEEARGVLGEALEGIEALSAAAGEFVRGVGGPVEASGLGREAVQALTELAALWPDCPNPDTRLLIGKEAGALRRAVAEVAEAGRVRDGVREEVLRRYREELLELDHLPHIDAVRRVLGQPAVLRLFTAGSVRKKLRAYGVGKLPPLPELLADLERARECKRMTADLLGRTEVAGALGSRWKGGNADWSEVEGLVEWCERFAAAGDVVAADPAAAGLMEALVGAVGERSGGDGLAEAGRELVRCWGAWSERWGEVERVVSASSEALEGEGAGWLPSASATLRRWLGSLGELNTWCAWNHSRAAAIEGGLGELVRLYESGGCGLAELGSVFERGFGLRWFNTVADGVEAVRAFNAEAQGDTIDRFRTLDRRSISMTQGVITARLHAAAPTISTASRPSPQSEIGILRRELEKQRRHLPTRRLIEAMPTLLPRLKPCFLMSPLSVAQYLDTKLPQFDLVVFDEASQIPVWDAIGAVARGREVVVVGDSKQLPPTNFFNTIDGDEDREPEDLGVEDMESILKECNASGIPGMRLRWHYRSRHESLIAFSNHHYYENELHTFPSPQERSERLGVTFRHVPEGVYDRGGSRTNRVEAERVVDEVVRMLRDAGDRDSIGIVTFSQAQQGLIEDLLDAKRRELPEIEPFFTDGVPEPVFVKNLENVQGDERDTIIFSVGYGPDQTGKLSMNFGPLNKDGGERRLNVAVTRARRRLMVFASITSDQIDLRRTRAVGVRDFRTFLDYANRGPRAIAQAVSVSGTREFESGFERAVWGALREKGWEVDTQVGCAGYRIDLAVRHPELPGKYLLGIECDGAAYHSAKTARDRDRLRQAVLEGLGWRIERVWSTEWKVNPDRCVAKIVRALDEALRAPEPTENGVTETDDRGAEGGSGSGATDEGEGGEPGLFGDAAIAESDSAASMTRAPASPAGEPYSVTALKNRRLAKMDIFEAAATEHAVSSLSAIVGAEGPIVEELAIRRLAGAFGVKRVTERLRQRFVEIREACVRRGEVTLAEGVLWRGGAEPAGYTAFRVPSEHPDSKRDIEEIPTRELANAVGHVLRVQFGLPREELIRETGRVFGISRATGRVAEWVSEAIDLAVALGLAEDDGERVTLCEGD